MSEVLRARRERSSDPMMRDIRASVDEQVGKTLDKRIAPGLMKAELVNTFMDTMLAYAEYILEQERPNARLLGGMARWRRQDVLRTDARAQRDNMTGYALKGIGVCAILIVLLVTLGVFGAIFVGLTRYFTPS